MIYAAGPSPLPGMRLAAALFSFPETLIPAAPGRVDPEDASITTNHREERRTISHVAQVQADFKDLESLKAAAAELGLEFDDTARRYRWYGRSVGDFPLPAGRKASDLGKCDIGVLRLTDAKLAELGASRDRAYEIGVCSKRDANGNTIPGYELLWDFYMGGYGLMDCVGNAKAGKLVAKYEEHVAMRVAKRKGMVCNRVQIPGTNKVRLEFTKR